MSAADRSHGGSILRLELTDLGLGVHGISIEDGQIIRSAREIAVGRVAWELYDGIGCVQPFATGETAGLLPARTQILSAAIDRIADTIR